MYLLGYITTEDMMRVLRVGSKIKTSRKRSFSSLGNNSGKFGNSISLQSERDSMEIGRRSSFSNLLRR
jgi:hypothetical protein